jgi:hypothetical protein
VEGGHLERVGDLVGEARQPIHPVGEPRPPPQDFRCRSHGFLLPYS